jgi:hypothetical protein
MNNRTGNAAQVDGDILAAVLRSRPGFRQDLDPDPTSAQNRPDPVTDPDPT